MCVYVYMSGCIGCAACIGCSCCTCAHVKQARAMIVVWGQRKWWPVAVPFSERFRYRNVVRFAGQGPKLEPLPSFVEDKSSSNVMS